MYNLTCCNCNSFPAYFLRTKETRESRAISSINELIVTRDEDSGRLEGLDRARDTHKAMVCERLEPTVVKILSNSIRSVVPARYLPGDNIEIRRTCQRPNQPSPRLLGWKSTQLDESGRDPFCHASY